MKKCVDVFENHMKKVHTGRASSHLLDSIQIEYYGSLTPLYQLANVVVEDSCTLAITVFDPNLVPIIGKAIMKSALGLNPVCTGIVIRVPLPSLTEERRRNLIKFVRTEAEQSRISIRNIRRNANEKIKMLLKEKNIDINEDRHFQNKIQTLTDTWIKNLDNSLAKKEADLIKV
ncbi:ribosome recycling factor [secondary endosymbiont of Heteropsylla cubana]